MPDKENEIKKTDEPGAPSNEKDQELSEQELDETSGGILTSKSTIAARITPQINFSVFKYRADCW